MPEAVKRKLTTILAADVAGYSRLMSADEEATLRVLKSYREIIDGLIGRHDGRIFGTGGDSVIAEFASAVEAVRCAITIQEELRIRNTELVAERQMKFRIGINVGDVMVEDDNLYGDGVNVAARLEGVAEAGGICISGSTYEQVKDKLSVGFEDIGPQEVKNITQPVPTFRIVPGPVSIAETVPIAITKRWRIPAIAAALVVIIAAGGLAWWQPWVTKIEAANLEDMAFPLPDKPSIAVLPFENLSGDAKQDYLGDGISENITTALSRVPSMFVIPRTTTRAYKGKAVTVAQVAEQLGVRYVLEGSVQRSGDQVRVTVQLIDALKGRHIWTERYERELQNTFALQDDITLNVLTELAVKLTVGEAARVQRGNTKNLEAYQLVRRGLRLFIRLTKESNAEARQLFEDAVELDPEYAIGWNFIGLTHQIAVNRRWAEDPAQATALALELAHKALALDPSGSAPYNILSQISGHGRRYDEAIGFAEKAVALSPNNSVVAAILGRTLIFAGRPEEALPPIQRAKRYSPLTPSTLSRWEGVAYHTLGRYEEAIAAFERARARNPKGVLPIAWLALTYADMGRVEEARAMAQQVLELSPSFSAKGFVNASMAFKDRTRPEHALATLRQLGLTKNQPLKLPDKPSIAVLAFQNMSDDPSQEYFADGMAEDIITDLSKLSALFVIARNSSFQYKGQTVDVKQVGRELGVRYVLEGSVRRAGNQVRISAQLIDTETGGHLWAERYDGQLSDVFALQDKVTGRIIEALSLTLGVAEKALLADHGTNNIDAHDAFLRGQSYARQYTAEGATLAIAHYTRALVLDPNYERAQEALAQIRFIEKNSGLR